MERVPYLDLPNCLRLHNDDIEVILTTDVGPRILRYAFNGGPNILGEFPDLSEATEFGEWKPYGGHRLWVAPEAMPHSYAPDNSPVEYRMEGKLAVRLTQPTNAAGIEKEMLVEIYPAGSRVDIHHRITNRGKSAIDAAVWALTIMREGTAIVPLEPYRKHGDVFLPSQPLILWPFTDLSDPRLKLGPGTIRLSSDPKVDVSTKIGIAVKQGWAGYHKGTTLFVKAFAYQEGLKYPDYGSNCELFTNGAFLEVESLGALGRLEPGASMDHTERWHLYPNVGVSELEARINALPSEGPTPGF